MDGPCLNSQIDLCYAPCDGRISKEEYHEHIKKIDLFFQGKYNKIIKDLEIEMKEAAKNQAETETNESKEPTSEEKSNENSDREIPF